jgi:hypothetical protein
VEQRFKDTKVIISLPMARADDDVVNSKNIITSGLSTIFDTTVIISHIFINGVLHRQAHRINVSCS